jgi:DNA-binding CsgD family transcriptional regulator
VLAHTDITELKLAGERVSAAESRERSMLEHLPDQVFTISPDGTLIDLIPAAGGGLVPIPESLPRGTNVRDILPPAAAAAILEAAAAAERTNKIALCRIRIQSESGERVYETRFAPASEGQLVAIARDLSPRDWIRVDATDTSRMGQSRIAPENRYGLTFRELTVLEAITRGQADKEIANELGVSVFTINKHVSNILRKMDATSRTEASTRTLRERLLE